MIYSRDEVLKATKSYFNDDVLAADVCVNKYLLKDKEGNFLEKSPDDMHKRMAKEFARIEQKYDNPLTEEEIYSTFKDFRYIVPQGSPMAGIGNNEHLTSLGNCFTENNFVLTNKGYKKISEVKIGDFVLSHKGLWKAVVNVMSRYYQGNIDVYTSSLLTNSIEVTPEHPFYNGNGIWVESKNNQKLMLLNFQHETNDYTFDLLNFVKQRHDQEIILDQSKISLKTKFIGRWGSNSQKNSHSINRFINLDENFAYVLGVFIGDGCVYSNHKDGEKLKGITITFSNKDQKNLLTIKQILENKFGCDFYINGDINKQNFNNVRKGNKILADFFSEICGRGFENKKIPDLIWHSSYEIKKSFLLGVLDSDGCVCRNGSIKLTITNKTLINNLQALAISLGYVFNNTLAKNKNYQDATNMYLSGYLSNELRQHSKKNYDDDRIEKKLEFNGLIPYIDESNDVETIRLIKNFKKEQKEFTGWVYNLSVEDDESYVVNNVICHNCNVIGNNSDSYGGILQLDQELAHLMKRRCVEEDSYVCTLEKGIIKLKDVEIGDYILSFNLQKKKSEFKKVLNKFKSEVNEEDRVKIIFSNGTELKTSKNHPILIKNENYEYKNVRDISLGEVGIKPELQDIKLNFDTSLSNIGWFIGSHIGDGTCGQIKQKTHKETNEHVSLKLRMRILNNNENVVKNYANILNELTESKSNYIKSKQKRYKVDVWEYSNNHSNINGVIEKYFDNQIGRKVYSAKIPSFIVQNNLWIPFIAGLIDTDGTIKDSKGISLELCAKSIIDGVSSFLSSIGVSFNSFERIPKNTKHHKLYGIKIHCSEVNIINLIKSFMVNDDKIEKLELLNNNLISHQQYNEINQGIFITSILNDETSLNYIDLEVEETNNFYSGNFGLVNIHNCGVGLDLSHIRPKDSPVNNAAITATGVVPFMERYSNTTREVAQCLYGDTLVLTEHGLVKIKDIKQGTKVWTKNGFVTVIDVIKNNKSVSKLTSKYGNEIICSLDHVIHTIEGEKKLKDLSEGDDVTVILGEGWNGKDIILNVNDYVSSFTNHNNRLNTDITFPNILDEEFAYFLGNCYGNGYTDNACEIEITSSWDEVIEKNKIIVKKLFNYDAKIQDKKTYKKLKIHSKLIVKFLQDNFCLKEKSHSIKFPEFLLTAKKEIVFSFISGFFDADGCFEKGKKSFSMTSTSKNFLLLIQQIFYSWGIRSKIHTKVRKNENWKTLYLLSIDGSQNQKLFYSLMVESIKVNSFPLQEKRNDWTSSIYTTKDFNTNAGKHDYISSSKQHLSYSVCVKLKEELGLDNKITLFKDYVETIEGMFDDELVEVYDLVLEKEHLFFGNCFYVHNSGRRGALLLSIDVKHPDAEDFIDAKLELKKVTGANISVKLSDEFLDAVVNKKPFIQQFPIDSDTPIISREIDPLPIWKKLVHNAWKSGEPGIFLWSKVISESPADCYSDEGFKTVTTNPSLRGDTLVLTDKGIFPIQELDGKEINVKNIFGEWKPASAFKSGTNVKLYKITFTNGMSVFCSKEHKWPLLTSNFHLFNHQTNKITKKETVNLKRRDKIYFPSFGSDILNVNSELTFNDGFISGWLYGDGSISEINDTKQFVFYFSEDDTKNGISEFCLNHINNIKNNFNICNLKRDGKSNSYTFTSSEKNVNTYFNNLTVDKKEYGLPKIIWKSNFEFIRGFIDGIFSSDGHVSKDKIQLTSSKKLLIDDIRKLLAFYGIKGNLTTGISKLEGYDKEYTRFDLCIQNKHLEKFRNLFSLSNTKKQTLLENIVIDGRYSKDSKIAENRDYLIVKSVLETDIFEDVYDITVYDNTHTFLMETGITGNCGEIPLAVGDACRLLLLNLYSFVEEPFTEKATFNFSLFEKHVEIAQRLMDDIVDLEEEKILKIIEKIKNHDPEELKIKLIELSLWNEIHHKLKSGRRTGLGITAEADMLAALGLRYATQEATEFSTLVHSKLAYYSLVSSVKMAEERGSFPIWNYEKEKDNPFLNRVLDLEEIPELRERYKTFGRRNISSLTIAPAGSVSLLTQTSSGVEPVISLYYVRRRKINPNDKTSTTHFIDELGDHWEEYNVVHPKFKDWATINHHCSFLDRLNKEEMIELIKLSPYYNSTANEIDPLEKVRMIGAIQQFVDHSISSTGNLPETASEDVVESYFFEAWKSGCKGITVYRDKCRSGVLLHSPSNEENKINIFKENHAPKRGKSLPCDIIRFSNKGDKWIGFLGLLDNKPYEVFTGPQEFVYIPSYVTEGKIVKEKSETLSKNIYNLVWVDKDGFVQEFKGLSRAFNREYWNIGRLVSGILRHGMPLPNVISLIDSLEIDNSESITNWKNGVKRMLKKYISEGTKVKGEVCPECGSHQFIYKEGCLSCQDCGWSKCG